MTSESSTSASDPQLISQILAGQTVHFRLLISRYEAKLLSYIYRSCGNQTLVEDIFQETCIAIFKNLHQYKHEYAFGGWAFGIARNKTNEHLRKQKVQFEVKESDSVDHHSPDKQLAQTDSSTFFWNVAKNLLNEEQYSIFWLRYQDELSIKQISQDLKLSESNVKINLFRARKALANSKALSHYAPQ